MHPHHDWIAALVPCYGAAGDTTVTLRADGSTQTTELGLRSVLLRLLREQALDLDALRKKSAQPGRRPVLQPLPLSHGLLLCPLKLRLPKVAGDTCTGYVNVHLVESVTHCAEPPHQCCLQLCGGHQLPAVWSLETVNRHLHTARLCQQRSYFSPQAAPDLLPMAHKIAELMYELLLYKATPHPSSYGVSQT